jgi:hypothetical protein
MGTKRHNNYEDLITFTRASAGHALRPVSYGSELVTNGTFDSDLSDWTTGANVTSAYSSGEAQLTLGGSLTSTGANWFRTTDEVFEAGKLYRVTFDATYVSGTIGTYGLQAGHGYTEDIRVKSSGTYTFTVDSTIGVGTQSDRNKLTFGGESTGVWKIDNVSVKEVTFDESDGTLTLFEHPDNIPRVEYDADGNRLGLLVEESRTNLVTDSAGASSDDLTANSSQTPNQSNSLTGLDDAFLVQATATGTNYRGQTSSVTLGTSYTSSRFLKAGTTNFAQLSMGSSGFGSDVYANFDLSNGTVATESNCDASLTNMGGGWYRCSITKAATATTSGTSPNYLTPVASGTSTVRTATSGDNVYQFGAQTEAGSFPTSYIKTTGSTATRSADVASIPVADFGFNADEMTLFVGFQSNGSDGADYPNAVSMWGDSASNKAIRIGLNQSNTLQSVVSNTSNQAVLNHGSYTVNTDSKVALAVKENDFASSASGASAVTDSAGTVPVLDELIIGGWGTGQYINGHIKSIKYYPRRLTNAQLQDLTS